MEIKIKLTNASYTMNMMGNSMTVEVTAMSEATDDKPSKPITSILGYYGPAQVDKGIDRIIAEEQTIDKEKVNLREFLIKYKEIHQSIAAQVEELKQILKENRKQHGH